MPGPAQLARNASAVAGDPDPGERIRYWDGYLAAPSRYESFRRYYRRRLIEIFAFLIPPGARVLELGCGQGDLLAALRPSYGAGLDFSAPMLASARARHPELHFLAVDG